MPHPRIRLKVDWNNDLDFADANEDLSADMLSWHAVRGREHASVLEAISTAGRLTAVLNNFDGKYSPSNTASPISPNLVQNRAVRLTHEPPLGYYGGFDGATSKITFGTTPSTIFAGTGTVEFLIRPYSDGGGNTGRIVDKRASATGGYTIFVGAEASGFVKLNLLVEFTTTDGQWSTTDAVVSLHKFTRAAWVYDSSGLGDPTLYLIESDGAFQTLTVGNGLDRVSTPVGTYKSDSTIAIRFGDSSAGGNFFDGDIDDPRFWNDGRTAQEVEDNAFTEVAVAAAGLVFYPKLNEESGTAVVDATGNESDGTATAVTWSNDHIWQGYLHDIVPAPLQRVRKLAVLEAFGAFAQFTEENAELAMATSLATGDAIDDVLDEIGWPAADRDVDAGQSTMPRFWSANTKALRLMRAIERTESGFLVEDRNGDIRFEDRHRRLLSPHTVAQATFSDAVASTLKYLDPRQQNPRQFIRNDFGMDVRQYTVLSSATLWTLNEAGASSPLLAPGESRTFKAVYPVASAAADEVGVDAWTTLVENTDYEANTASDGSGTDVSSDIAISSEVKRGGSYKFTLTNNNASAAYITLLQARGTAVRLNDSIPISAEDAASITKYGRRSISLSEHFIGDSGEGQNWADFNVSVFAKEIPVVDLVLMGNTSVFHMFKAARLDISDRVTVVATSLATQLGINEDCFIERIDASMGEEQVLRVKYALSPASAYSNFWILGTSELGTDTILAF